MEMNFSLYSECHGKPKTALTRGVPGSDFHLEKAGQVSVRKKLRRKRKDQWGGDCQSQQEVTVAWARAWAWVVKWGVEKVILRVKIRLENGLTVRMRGEKTQGASEVPDPRAARQQWPHLSDRQGWFQCSVGRRAWLEFRREWNVEKSKRWVETPLSRVCVCARVWIIKWGSRWRGMWRKQRFVFVLRWGYYSMFITVCDDGQEEGKASERRLIPWATGLIPSSPVSRGEHAPVCPYSRTDILKGPCSCLTSLQAPRPPPHTHTHNSLSFLCRMWYLGTGRRSN